VISGADWRCPPAEDPGGSSLLESRPADFGTLETLVFTILLGSGWRSRRKGIFSAHERTANQAQEKHNAENQASRINNVGCGFQQHCPTQARFYENDCGSAPAPSNFSRDFLRIEPRRSSRNLLGDFQIDFDFRLRHRATRVNVCVPVQVQIATTALLLKFASDLSQQF
jgi:hypothetical protein